VISESQFHQYLLWGGFISAVAVFFYLLYVPAPYGRHVREGWGPSIPNRIGWILMETPAVLTILICYLISPSEHIGAAWAFLLVWETHYLYRTYVFPFRLQTRGKRMPVLIAVSGMVFNVVNGYLNGRYLSYLGPVYGVAWLSDPRFLVGALLFFLGLAVNVHSDIILQRLRSNGSTGYRIPRGGLYRWVSCPNYLGEIIEWTGFAILTWSLPGLLFAVWTFANLAPRAVANHRWYRQHFPDYPKTRKALIPYLV
jgi:protein-S-isoprenylcysteine O-methyltransferase Ste14